MDTSPRRATRLQSVAVTCTALSGRASGGQPEFRKGHIVADSNRDKRSSSGKAVPTPERDADAQAEDGKQGEYGEAQPLDQAPSGTTEPRDGTRIGEHSSQGLAGAQGSGGGAERGINQPPPRRGDSGRG
jgi:hypothetical protein